MCSLPYSPWYHIHMRTAVMLEPLCLLQSTWPGYIDIEEENEGKGEEEEMWTKKTNS